MHTAAIADVGTGLLFVGLAIGSIVSSLSYIRHQSAQFGGVRRSAPAQKLYRRLHLLIGVAVAAQIVYLIAWVLSVQEHEAIGLISHAIPLAFWLFMQVGLRDGMLDDYVL